MSLELESSFCLGNVKLVDVCNNNDWNKHVYYERLGKIAFHVYVCLRSKVPIYILLSETQERILIKQRDIINDVLFSFMWNIGM